MEYLADCLGWSGALSRGMQRLREWAVSGPTSTVTSAAAPARREGTLLPRSAAGPSAVPAAGRQGPARSKQADSGATTRSPRRGWQLWAWLPPPTPPRPPVVFRRAVPPPPPRQPIKALRIVAPRLPRLPLAATLKTPRPLQRPLVPARVRLPARGAVARRARLPSRTRATSMSNRVVRRRPIWPTVVHLRVRLRRVKRALMAGLGGRALERA